MKERAAAARASGIVEKFAIRLALGILAFAAFAATAVDGPWGARRIEKALKDGADSRLSAAGFDWAQSEADGRVLRLSGLAPHRDAIAAARAVADGPGVARIDISGLGIESPPEPPVSLPAAVTPPEPVQIAEADAPTLGDCRNAINRVLDGRRITFLSSSVRLSASDRAILDNIVDALPACGAFTVTVEGHTDASGSTRSNQSLSERRARAVTAYLEERAPAAKLVMRGYGESRPIASNRTLEGRRANRRIDFVASSETEGEAQTQ